MPENINTAKDTTGIAQFEKDYLKPYCIVLDSLYCSMGRMIALKACKETGYNYYDSYELIKLVNTEITFSEVEQFEKKLISEDYCKEDIINSEEYDHIRNSFDKAIKTALKRGPALIHDRAVKEKIQKMGYTCLSVLIYANDIEDKIIRAKISPLFDGIENRHEIIKGIEKQDLIRRNYHSLQSNTIYGDKDSYDLCINTDAFGRDYSSEILASIMK